MANNMGQFQGMGGGAGFGGGAGMAMGGFGGGMTQMQAAGEYGAPEEQSTVGTGTEENVILQSSNGYFIRFNIAEIPEMKKTAAGVKGMKLDGTDKVENAYITDIVSENVIEYGTRTVSLNSIKLLGRGAKGTRIKG